MPIVNLHFVIRPYEELQYTKNYKIDIAIIVHAAYVLLLLAQSYNAIVTLYTTEYTQREYILIQ